MRVQRLPGGCRHPRGDRGRCDPGGNAHAGGRSPRRGAADAARPLGRRGADRGVPPPDERRTDADLSRTASGPVARRGGGLFSLPFLRPDVPDGRGAPGLPGARPAAARLGPRHLRRVRPPDAGPDAAAGWRRRRPRGSLLLETVARLPDHGAGLRCRLLRREQPAALRRRGVRHGPAERRVPLHLAETDAGARHAAGGGARRRHRPAPPPQRAGRELHRRRRPDPRRVPRPLPALRAATLRRPAPGGRRPRSPRHRSDRRCTARRTGRHPVGHPRRQPRYRHLPAPERARPPRCGRRAARQSAVPDGSGRRWPDAPHPPVPDARIRG